MISGSLPYAEKIGEFFYEGLGRQTSVCLFGSAATGNWVPGRSDLDLVIFVPEEHLEQLGRKIRAWVWSSAPTYPILDGYALAISRDRCSIWRLDEFARVTFPSNSTIDLVDQWMIKYRSKHLFGSVSIPTLFPDISQSELRAWASEELMSLLASNPQGNVPAPAVVLSKLIWSVSWAARMLMLLKGSVCESKREALQWLAREYVETRNLVCLLLDNYLMSDEIALSITSEQSQFLCRFCLEKLRQESKSERAIE